MKAVKMLLRRLSLFLVITLFSITCFCQAVSAGTSTAQSAGASPLESALKKLAADIVQQMKMRNISKIAVDDFTQLDGFSSTLGEFVSEELITNLYMVGAENFDVVERRELARIMKEQRLGSSGLFNKESLSKIGKLLGVEAIVTGSIADLVNGVKINARMIGVENAKVFAAASAKIPMNETIRVLMDKGSAQGSEDRQAHRYKTIWKNDFLAIDQVAISKTEDKRDMVMTFLFRNITKNEIMIAMDDKRGNNNFSIGAILDLGNGKRELGSGLIGLNSCEGESNVNKYSTIAPGKEALVSFQFGYLDLSESGIVSLLIEMYRYTEKGVTPFIVGIPRLKI